VLNPEIISYMLQQLMEDIEDSGKTKIVKVLGVLAETSLSNRACLFNQTVVMPLVHLLNTSENEELIAAILSSYKSLCMREMAMENIEQYGFGLPVISKFIFHSNPSIVSDTITVLGYIAGCHSYRHESKNDEVIVGRSMMKVFIDLLDCCDHPLHETALEAVVNIAFLNEYQTQILLESDFLSYLIKTIKCENKKHEKFSCWILANLTSKVTSEQIAKVFESKILSYVIHELLNKDSIDDLDLLKYSLWTLQNVTYNATSEQIAKLVSDGCIDKLCKYLSTNNKQPIVKSALDALDNILPHGDVLSEYDELVNHFVSLVTSCNGRELLKELMECKAMSSDIREEAGDLYQYYYEKKKKDNSVIIEEENV